MLVHNKCSGSYEIQFESGKNYVGKGNKARMGVSARVHSTLNHDPVVSKVWQEAPDAKTAFFRKGIESVVGSLLNFSPGYLIAYIISLFGKVPGKEVRF